MQAAAVRLAARPERAEEGQAGAKAVNLQLGFGGNVVDRVAYGAVADFLNMSCCGFSNPFSFNVADISIFAGAIALAIIPPAQKQG